MQSVSFDFILEIKEMSYLDNIMTRKTIVKRQIQ